MFRQRIQLARNTQAQQRTVYSQQGDNIYDPQQFDVDFKPRQGPGIPQIYRVLTLHEVCVKERTWKNLQ
jgi:hypothetical protein